MRKIIDKSITGIIILASIFMVLLGIIGSIGIYFKIIDIILINGNPRMTGVENRIEDFAERSSGINTHHLGTGNHNFTENCFIQLQN